MSKILAGWAFVLSAALCSELNAQVTGTIIEFEQNVEGVEGNDYEPGDEIATAAAAIVSNPTGQDVHVSLTVIIRTPFRNGFTRMSRVIVEGVVPAGEMDWNLGPVEATTVARKADNRKRPIHSYYTTANLNWHVNPENPDSDVSLDSDAAEFLRN